jgi:malonyl CoA-acyl carrier protein transacylase
LQTVEQQFRIGFITPPFKDNKIPVTDHLHAHAYIAPGDLMGWWRGIAYSPVAWYSIDDLIAEIRLVITFSDMTVPSDAIASTIKANLCQTTA